MAEDLDMATLLQRLRQVGELNSSGEFTLDPSRASLLLEKYQLPSSSYFMLHAVGAALASDARRVDIELRRHLFSVTFDGAAFSSTDASECVASLWSRGGGERETRLQELAIARGGAFQWGASEFRLESLDDGRQRLLVTRPGMMARLSGGLLGPRKEELDVVRDHLAHTLDCRITVNGRALPDLELPTSVLRGFAVGGAGVDLLERLPEEVPTDVLEGHAGDEIGMICHLAPGLYSPLWSQGGQGKARRSFWPGFMDVVLNGRFYRCQMPAGWSQWWGIFYARGLRRDLSFSFLAEDDLARLHSHFVRARESTLS